LLTLLAPLCKEWRQVLFLRQIFANLACAADFVESADALFGLLEYLRRVQCFDYAEVDLDEIHIRRMQIGVNLHALALLIEELAEEGLECRRPKTQPFWSGRNHHSNRLASDNRVVEISRLQPMIVEGFGKCVAFCKWRAGQLK